MCVLCVQAVYIAPLKALVRERIEDWKVRIEQRLGKKYDVILLIYCWFFNPLKCSGVRQLHLKVFNAIQV